MSANISNIANSNTNNTARSLPSFANDDNTVVCDEGCYVMSKPVLHGQAFNNFSGGRAFSVLPGQTGRIYNGQTRQFYMPDDGNGPTGCDERAIGTVTRINTVGNANHSLGAAANIGGTGSARARYTYNFPYPIDVHMSTGSLNGNEFVIIRSLCDEFHRVFNGVNRVSAHDYNNLTVHDSNNQGGDFFYRNVTQVVMELDSENGLSSGFNIQQVMGPVGLEPIQCRVPSINPNSCGAGTTAHTELKVAEIIADPSWLVEKPLSTASPAWEFSSNSGTTWGPSPATHITRALHVNRWRTTVNIPQGYEGYYRLEIRGGINDTGVGGDYYYDGIYVNTQRILVNTGTPYNLGFYRDSSYYFPVTPGVHVVEFRENAGAGAADINLVADYRGVHKVRYGYQKYSCKDNAGVDVPGSVSFVNYDGTPYVPVGVMSTTTEVY